MGMSLDEVLEVSNGTLTRPDAEELFGVGFDRVLVELGARVKVKGEKTSAFVGVFQETGSSVWRNTRCGLSFATEVAAALDFDAREAKKQG